MRDAGTLYGAIVVERFRTFAGNLFELADRWKRFSYGLTTLDIDFSLSQQEFANSCNQLLDVNRELVTLEGDVSVVAVASPGEVDNETATPSIVFHLSPLPWKKLSNWYQFGTSLFLSSYAAVPDACWPAHIKTRSRLPYYLSDVELRKNQRTTPKTSSIEALPLLKTVRGTIADTSVANIVIVDKNGVIRSPATGSSLEGCSLELAKRLLRSCGQNLVRTDIDESELYVAREVWLTGSTGCIWRASSLNAKRIGTDTESPIYRHLKAKWIEHVDLDFEAQAMCFAT